MKALTLHQGWADLIFSRGKDIENRLWSTDYRGELLIHAGRSRMSIAHSKQFCESLGFEFLEPTVFGAIVGIVTLTNCQKNSSSPWAMADHYHWKLENPRRFDTPIYCSGQQKLWSVSDDSELFRLISQR